MTPLSSSSMRPASLITNKEAYSALQFGNQILGLGRIRACCVLTSGALPLVIRIEADHPRRWSPNEIMVLDIVSGAQTPHLLRQITNLVHVRLAPQTIDAPLLPAPDGGPSLAAKGRYYITDGTQTVQVRPPPNGDLSRHVLPLQISSPRPSTDTASSAASQASLAASSPRTETEFEMPEGSVLSSDIEAATEPRDALQ